MIKKKSILVIIMIIIITHLCSAAFCDEIIDHSIKIKLIDYDYSTSNNWGEKHTIYTIDSSSYEYLDTDYRGFDSTQSMENMSMRKILLRFQMVNTQDKGEEDNSAVQITNVRSHVQGTCRIFPKEQMYVSAVPSEMTDKASQYWMLEALCVYPIDMYFEDAVEQALCDTTFECDAACGAQYQSDVQIQADNQIKREKLFDQDAYSAVVSSVEEEVLSVESDFYDETYIKIYISKYIPQAIQNELLQNPEHFALAKISFYIENRKELGICNIRRRLIYPTDNIWMVWGADDDGGEFQVYWGKGKHYCEDILLLYRKSKYPQIEELMKEMRINISFSNEYAGDINWEEGGGSGWPGPIMELPLIYND